MALAAVLKDGLTGVVGSCGIMSASFMVTTGVNDWMENPSLWMQMQG